MCGRWLGTRAPAHHRMHPSGTMLRGRGSKVGWRGAHVPSPHVRAAQPLLGPVHVCTFVSCACTYHVTFHAPRRWLCRGRCVRICQPACMSFPFYLFVACVCLWNGKGCTALGGTQIAPLRSAQDFCSNHAMGAASMVTIAHTQGMHPCVPARMPWACVRVGCCYKQAASPPPLPHGPPGPPVAHACEAVVITTGGIRNDAHGHGKAGTDGPFAARCCDVAVMLPLPQRDSARALPCVPVELQHQAAPPGAVSLATQGSAPGCS